VPKSTTLALLAGAVLTALALTACGGGSSGAGPATTTTTAPSDAALQFTQCMRQHGIDIPDPPAGATTVQLPGSVKTNPNYPAASSACQHFLNSGGAKDPNDPAQQDKSLALAQCLRAHGLQVADPQPGQPLRLNLNSHDPNTMQIIQDCRSSTSGSATPTPAG
jgi:hypothetical protein